MTSKKISRKNGARGFLGVFRPVLAHCLQCYSVTRFAFLPSTTRPGGPIVTESGWGDAPGVDPDLDPDFDPNFRPAHGYSGGARGPRARPSPSGRQTRTKIWVHVEPAPANLFRLAFFFFFFFFFQVQGFILDRKSRTLSTSSLAFGRLRFSNLRIPPKFRNDS